MSPGPRVRIHFGLALLAGLGACESERPPDKPAARQFPRFEQVGLQQGRQVWLGTCAGCHDIGVAGAPPLGDVAAWAPRIAKGVETLHAHAREGFFGPGGTMMPARGGNDALSDAEVAAAVDYMVAASRGR